MSVTCSNGLRKHRPPATDQEIRGTLFQDVLELTARTEEATKEFEVISGRICMDQPHPDDVERMKNAFLKLSTARKELMKAHQRLVEHCEARDAKTT